MPDDEFTFHEIFCSDINNTKKIHTKIKPFKLSASLNLPSLKSSLTSVNSLDIGLGI
ncbi:MAG: hypothetical protein ACFFAI_16780 [Promethearchaeota archaeon]